MSYKKQIIAISPENIYRGENTEEFTLKGFECPYCSAKGHLIEEGPFEHGYKKEKCPVCKGAGRIKAMVSIAWIADSSNTND